MKSWHTLFLAIWLILVGLVGTINLSFSGLPTILAILAIVAGVFLILAGKKLKVFHHLGGLLLAIWLIVTGVFSLFSIAFNGSAIILGILAIVAGIFLLMGLGKKIASHLAALLLAIYLILHGLMVVFSLAFSASAIILGILALASGILLLIQKAK